MTASEAATNRAVLASGNSVPLHARIESSILRLRRLRCSKNSSLNTNSSVLAELHPGAKLLRPSRGHHAPPPRETEPVTELFGQPRRVESAAVDAKARAVGKGPLLKRFVQTAGAEQRCGLDVDDLLRSDPEGLPQEKFALGHPQQPQKQEAKTRSKERSPNGTSRAPPSTGYRLCKRDRPGAFKPNAPRSRRSRRAPRRSTPSRRPPHCSLPARAKSLRRSPMLRPAA